MVTTVLKEENLQNYQLPGSADDYELVSKKVAVRRTVTKMREVVANSSARDVDNADTVMTEEYQQVRRRRYTKEEVDIMGMYTHPALIFVTRKQCLE